MAMKGLLMYIPIDPAKDYGYLNKLANSLRLNDFYPYITNGKSFRLEETWKNRQEDIIKDIVRRMKSANYSRIGTNRNVPIPPHFAIEIEDNKKGKLVELISIDDSKETLVNDINLVIQFTFFDNPHLEELIIPLVIEGIDNSEVDITFHLEDSVTYINRRI